MSLPKKYAWLQNVSSDTLICSPSAPKPLVNCASFYAECFRRFHNSHSATVKFMNRVCALIALLFASWNPAAIFWAVISVVVAALKSIATRTLAHVSKKVVKTITPTLAHLNAATAVVLVFFSVGCITSPAHFDPRSLRWAVCISMPTVGLADFGNQFLSCTTAPFGFSRPQIKSTNFFFSPASAFANRATPIAANDSPQTVLLSNV